MGSSFESLLDPEILLDPDAALSELRANQPVFWDPKVQGWIVTRHADARRVLVDPRLSRDRRLTRFYSPPRPGSWMARNDDDSNWFADPDSHRHWRKQIAVGFTPRAVRRMEGQVRDVVGQFAEPLKGRRGEVDLAAEFTNPIPNTVISRITGIPPYPGDEDRFRRLAQDVIRQFIPLADETQRERGERAMNELAEWIEKLADARRQEPADDLLSDLIEGNQGDYAMSNAQIIQLVTMLVAAGSETTTLGGNNALQLLLEHPDQLALLRREPSRVDAAVREVLRFGIGGPIGLPKTALEDIEIGGVTIRKGDMAMVSTRSANRDETVFEDPNRFDIARDTRESLAFGTGPHYCLGANLALQELRCMLEAALDFLPEDARLGEIEWEPIGAMRRQATLPVDFG